MSVERDLKALFDVGSYVQMDGHMDAMGRFVRGQLGLV